MGKRTDRTTAIKRTDNYQNGRKIYWPLAGRFFADA